MKCTACLNDCKLRERSDGHCPKCRQKFVFEPQSGDPITDAGFLAAIEAVSSGGSVRFLRDHVYYELARRKRKRGTGRIVGFTVGACMFAAGFAVPLLFIGAGIAGIVGLAAWPNKTVKLERTAFESLWNRWVHERGAPKGLIVRREIAAPYRGPVDIPSYSFDRAVICDHGSTVDLLLANNFHFENNCAVLAVDGYPQHAFETIRGMLRNNPRLTVYALHSATPAGCRLAHMLANDKNWFKGSRVVEVGLRPAHAKPMRGLWLPADESVQHGVGVSKSERAWLDKYLLDITAIRPEQVIKRLFACITNDATLIRSDQVSGVELGSDGSGDPYWVDAWTFGEDAHASDGGDDSFG